MRVSTLTFLLTLLSGGAFCQTLVVQTPLAVAAYTCGGDVCKDHEYCATPVRPFATVISTTFSTTMSAFCVPKPWFRCGKNMCEAGQDCVLSGANCVGACKT
jgi:hypothetical protein